MLALGFTGVKYFINYEQTSNLILDINEYGEYSLRYDCFMHG